MRSLLLPAVLLLTLSALQAAAQKPKQANWQLESPEKDKTPGAGVEAAYRLLGNRPHKTVTVAVIDIGTDINHEDLKDVIWTNPGEIPGNGIDDDHNGYIDDIHGWNFLGGKHGNIGYEATELTRLYKKQAKKYAVTDTSNLTGKDADDFNTFKKLRSDYLSEKISTERQYKALRITDSFFTKVKLQHNGVLNKAALKAYKPENALEEKLKKKMKFAFTLGMGDEVGTQVTEAFTEIENQVRFYYIDADSLRRAVVGDDPDDPHERYYGNNNVIGPEPSHGTHTAGIIGAVRNNGKGPDGVANDVRIMVVRAVPWGDERDKDIANAIRYAVDNGATVINMSFGKSSSPDKQVVDEAVQYAVSKDVLMVHGAGNEGTNNDSAGNFPSPNYLSGGTATGWIEVGATGRKKGKKLVASFSNYGKSTVDLFAPGENIYSTMPNDSYRDDSGTSMAAPVVAGIGALIREYFPGMKAADIKALLLRTVTRQDKNVIVPGTTDREASLSEISVSGGVVNAAQAIKELVSR